jgi:hypothetical protein
MRNLLHAHPCLALWWLTALFALRVAAQPLALTVPMLPSFDAWHSGVLPYPALLAFQLVVLAVMVTTNRACTRGRLAHRPRLARALTVLGTIYFVGMLARLALGQILNPAPAWFDRPLPTLFHLFLSIWLLLLARRVSEHAR